MLSHYTLSAGGHYSNYKSDLDVWNNPALRAVLRHARRAGARQHHMGRQPGLHADSPTITIQPCHRRGVRDPRDGPIPPTTIIYLSQSGWSIDRVLECCVQQINDVETPLSTNWHTLSPPTPAVSVALRRS